MFTVLFEVQPHGDRWDMYLANAKALRPELEVVEGFVDNIRYRSLTREGLILSLSSWRDEKAVVRWRTAMRHHEVQQKGRNEILRDYHLRVGQVTSDTSVPAGHTLREQRLDETEIGEGTTITLLNSLRPALWTSESRPEAVAESLGLMFDADGLRSWDVYDGVLTPGDVIAMCVWRDVQTAENFARLRKVVDDVRFRQVRIIRDYGMFDRREAPQYYPDAPR